MRRAAAIAAMSISFLRAASSAAEPEAHETPCISVDSSDDVLDANGRARIVEQFEAALAQHHIERCPSDKRAAAIAEVSFEGSGKSGVRVRVRDAVTRKEVARTVSLGTTPRDGRALAVALAADELLRATWAEIALTPPPRETPPSEPPPIATPSEARALVVESLPPARPHLRAFTFDLAFAFEHSTGGLDQGGIDMRAAAWLAPRVALSVRLGARLSPRANATDGSADATTVLAGLGGIVALLPRDRAITLDLPLRIDLERVDFGARPSPGARGTNAADYALLASTGLTASLRLSSSWALGAEGTIGYALRPIEALDASSSFTALSGVLLGGGLFVRALP